MRRQSLLAIGMLVAFAAMIFGSSSSDLRLDSMGAHGPAPRGGSHAEAVRGTQAVLPAEAEAQFRIQPLAQSERDRTLGVANLTLLVLSMVAILLLAPRRPKRAWRVAQAPSRSPPLAPVRVISLF